MVTFVVEYPGEWTRRDLRLWENAWELFGVFVTIGLMEELCQTRKGFDEQAVGGDNGLSPQWYRKDLAIEMNFKEI